MAHTFTSLLTHIVFSTKDRRPLLHADIEAETHRYMTGIARNLKIRVLAIDGTVDHAHMLLQLPASVSVSEAVGKLKSNSSKWIHERFATHSKFGWQTGYGAFSVSRSNAAEVIRYIEGQKEHHRHHSFQEEFIAFLERNEIEYDEAYIWE